MNTAQTNNHERNAGTGVGTDASPLIRVGLPVSLAIVAAALNVAAIRRQITPIQAYVYTNHLLPGHRLTASDLKLVSLPEGYEDASLCLTPATLRTEFGDDQRTLEEILEQSPRFIEREVYAGERVILPSIGGRELVQPGANEEMMRIPRSAVRGGASNLKPGQDVYFMATTHSSEQQQTREIGPFRVAFEERTKDSRKKSSDSSGTFGLIYRLDKQGRAPDHARALQESAVTSNRVSLLVIEKGYRSVTSRSGQSVSTVSSLAN